MTRIWLKSYPDGVPADVDLGKLRTVAIDHEAAPGTPIRSLTYRWANLSRTGSWMSCPGGSQLICRKRRPRKGRAVLRSCCRTCCSHPIAMFCRVAQRASWSSTPNPLYRAQLEHQPQRLRRHRDPGTREFRTLRKYCADTAETRVLTSVGECWDFPKSAIVNLRRAQTGASKYLPGTAGGCPVSKWRSPREGLTFDPVDIRLKILPTSSTPGGTTGVAKGAMLTNTRT